MRALTTIPLTASSLEVTDVPDASPHDGDLLVDGIAVGVCGTDKEISRGEYGWGGPGPERAGLGAQARGRGLGAARTRASGPGPRVAGQGARGSRGRGLRGGRPGGRSGPPPRPGTVRRVRAR